MKFISFSCLLFLFLTACGKEAKESTRNAPNDSLSLRVALLPTLGSLPVVYAVESGICERLKLPLRYHLCGSQWEADTALLGKTADIAYLDAARWDYYQSRGQMRNAHSLISLQEDYRLVLGGHLRVRKLEQLKTRTIAAPRYTQQERHLHHLRDSLGLKIDDIYQPQINSFEVGTRMLNNQQIDGIVLPEPWSSQAIDGGNQALGGLSKWRQAALYVKAFGKAKPRKKQQIALFKKAYNQAVAELNAQRLPLVDSLLTQRYHLSPTALSRIKLPRYKPLP